MVAGAQKRRRTSSGGVEDELVKARRDGRKAQVAAMLEASRQRMANLGLVSALHPQGGTEDEEKESYFPQPRGRPPNGKSWDKSNGCWIDNP